MSLRLRNLVEMAGTLLTDRLPGTTFNPANLLGSPVVLQRIMMFIRDDINGFLPEDGDQS